MAEQTEEDRVAYTEQNKVLSHFSKYPNDHRKGGNRYTGSANDDPEEELELPSVELSDDLQPNCRQIRNQIMRKVALRISEAMRAISDMCKNRIRTTLKQCWKYDRSAKQKILAAIANRANYPRMPSMLPLAISTSRYSATRTDRQIQALKGCQLDKHCPQISEIPPW